MTDHDTDAPEPRAQHPFFHTMVLMGSALALGCGGLSDGKVAGHDGTGGTGAGGGSGGSGAATGAVGGSGPVAVGGSGGSGAATGAVGGSGPVGGTGSIVIGSGGNSAGAGGAAIAIGGGPSTHAGTGGMGSPSSACAPAQWDCDDVYLDCYGATYVLPSDCRCDVTRPQSRENCGQGESFVCRQATVDASGAPLAAPLTFSCACVPTPTYCETACEDAGFGHGTCTSSMDLGSILCGCAQVVLR